MRDPGQPEARLVDHVLVVGEPDLGRVSDPREVDALETRQIGRVSQLHLDEAQHAIPLDDEPAIPLDDEPVEESEELEMPASIDEGIVEEEEEDDEPIALDEAVEEGEEDEEEDDMPTFPETPLFSDLNVEEFKDIIMSMAQVVGFDEESIEKHFNYQEVEV